MITALFLAAAAHLPTAVDAERAFAADARRNGQWSAFRKTALPDAVMFTPQAVFAQDFLKDRKDPPRSIAWWPTQSFVACDGRTAVNLGAAVDAEGKPLSLFTTVWQRNGRSWRWAYDGGAPIAGKPLPSRSKAPVVQRASCRAKAPGAPVIPPLPLTDKQARKTPEDSGRGESADKTLGWDWRVEKDGSRFFRVFLWNGARYAQAVYQHVPAPTPGQ
ncbi:MAG: hypothetical protein V4444_08620 [Pseudomonadota bacterium]